MEKIISPRVSGESFTPVLISADKTPLVDHPQSVFSLNWDHVHYPNGKAFHGGGKASQKSVHVHDVAVAPLGEGRNDILVMRNSKIPEICVFDEG